MIFQRKIIILTGLLTVVLLQGCGTGGGGDSSSWSEVKTTYSNNSDRDGEHMAKTMAKYKHLHPKDYLFEYETQSGFEPSAASESELLSRVPYDSSLLNKNEQDGLHNALSRAVTAYKNFGKSGSPVLRDLIRARFYTITGKPQNSLEDFKLSGSREYSQMIQAMNDVTNLCRAGKVGGTLGDPGFIKNQSYLTRVADHSWKVHSRIMAQVRNMNNSLQDGDKIGNNTLMVADIGNSQALFTGLEDDHWYVYGRGYAFRGYWEPEAGLKQEYKGEGAEFGAFRSVGNGFMLGGMLGLQNVRMEVDAGLAGNMNSDAQIYRIGPFVSWSDDHWTVDSMLTYGWASLNTSRRDFLQSHWKASPKGSEWAAYLQTSYSIPLDNWTMGLSFVPEAYVGYRIGTIEQYTEKSDAFRNSVSESKHKGLTTRLGAGLGYVFPDLRKPTDVMLKLGLQKTQGWESQDKSSANTWAKVPKAESRDTALYYSLAFNRQFGADLDKLIGLEYTGTSGDKSGSDALIFTYRQAF